MPPNADLVYKTADQLIAEILAAWQVRFPDAPVGPDTVMRLWSEVFANTGTGFYLGMQLLHDDMYIQTMSALALQRKGEQIGRSRLPGTLSSGTVRFTGSGGAYIGIGTEVAAPLADSDDVLLFATTAAGTIPNPGDPTAPTTVDSGVAGVLTGTYEYAVTFVTAGGETEIGDISAPVTVAAKKIHVSAVPVGGPGTTARKIYRRINGGMWGLLQTVADIVTTDLGNDNTAATTTAPPDASTAERITLAASSEEVGIENNVGVGTITDLANAPSNVTDVINLVAFTGGSDEEDLETFRTALLKKERAPGSGSAEDLVSIVTGIPGIDSAAVFKNIDLTGASALGTVVIRIAGPAGAIPDSDLVDAAQAAAEAADLANITILVGTFAAHNIDVEVTPTMDTGYVLADVTPSIQQAITDYINSIPVGGTVYTAGIYSAVFGLAGVKTLVVNSPGSPGTTSTATQKPVAGTILVS